MELGRDSDTGGQVVSTYLDNNNNKKKNLEIFLKKNKK